MKFVDVYLLVYMIQA